MKIGKCLNGTIVKDFWAYFSHQMRFLTVISCSVTTDFWVILSETFSSFIMGRESRYLDLWSVWNLRREMLKYRYGQGERMDHVSEMSRKKRKRIAYAWGERKEDIGGGGRITV